MNCCGAFEETTDGEREQVKREGLVFKFPFETEKKSYQVWDGTLGKTITAKFVKETDDRRAQGLRVPAEIPRTQVGTREVPASVVGEPGTGNVEAAIMYALDKHLSRSSRAPARSSTSTSTRTHRSAIDGEDKVTTTEARLAYTKATVDERQGLHVQGDPAPLVHDDSAAARRWSSA